MYSSLIVMSLFASWAAPAARAESAHAKFDLLDRDRTYEEDLRWEASDDKDHDAVARAALDPGILAGAAI